VAYAAANGQADFTHQQAALFYEKWRHGRHFEIKTSKQKSDWVNQKNIPANFILIQFETTEPYAFLKSTPHQVEQDE